MADNGYACCPHCTPSYPLICTFEVPKKEWYCMMCETYFDFLSARRAAEGTDQDALGKTYEHALALMKDGKRTLKEPPTEDELIDSMVASVVSAFPDLTATEADIEANRSDAWEDAAELERHIDGTEAD